MKVSEKAINIGYSFLVNGGNYLFPFYVLFFASKILGNESFGIYAICTGLTVFFQVFIDFGFSLSGCREVSRNHNAFHNLSKILLSITYAKLILVFFSFVLIIAYIVMFEIKFYFELIIAAGCVFLNSLIPFWFYQGLGSYKSITLIISIGRFISVLLAIFTVKGSGDLVYIFLSQFLGAFFSFSLVNIYLFKDKYFSMWREIKLNDLIISFRLGWNTFGANLSSLVMANSGVLILGVYQGASVVGGFSIVDRIVKMLVSLVQPLSQVFFPINSLEFKSGWKLGVKNTRINNLFIIAYVIGIVSLVVLFIDTINKYFNFNDEDIIVFKILLFGFFISALNNVMGIQILTASGNSSAYSRCFIFAAVLFLCGSLPVVSTYSSIGLAILMVVCEISLAIIMFFIIIRKSKNED